MISDEERTKFAERMRRDWIARVKHDIEPMNLGERADYLREMNEKRQAVASMFTHTAEQEIAKLIHSKSPEVALSGCRASVEKYQVMKSYVWSRLEYPNPHVRPLPAKFLEAVLKDLVDPYPGPRPKRGAPNKDDRNRQIVELFELLKETVLYNRKLGTNPATKGETAVSLLARVFRCSQQSVRDVINR